MSVESTTQALCNLALKFGEGGDNESMVSSDATVAFVCIVSFECVERIKTWVSLLRRHQEFVPIKTI